MHIVTRHPACPWELESSTASATIAVQSSCTARCLLRGLTRIAVCRYGDVSPITYLGRITVIASLGTVLMTVPAMSNSLVAMLSSKSVYTRTWFRPNSRSAHVVVCGALGSTVEGAASHWLRVHFMNALRLCLCFSVRRCGRGRHNCTLCRPT